MGSRDSRRASKRSIAAHTATGGLPGPCTTAGLLEEGEQLRKFWHRPLKQLLADKSIQNQLVQFQKADSASSPQCCKEQGFVDPYSHGANFRPTQGLPYGSEVSFSRFSLQRFASVQ